MANGKGLGVLLRDVCSEMGVRPIMVSTHPSEDTDAYVIGIKVSFSINKTDLEVSEEQLKKLLRIHIAQALGR